MNGYINITIQCGGCLRSPQTWQMIKQIGVKQFEASVKNVKMKPLWKIVGGPRTDGCLICEQAMQPFAVRCSPSETGQSRFEFGSVLPWQNVFKQRKWNSHKPWQPQNNNWQWHFTAGVTRRSTAATILWSNVSLFLYDEAGLANNVVNRCLSFDYD